MVRANVKYAVMNRLISLGCAAVGVEKLTVVFMIMPHRTL